jgi:transposase InsO family protein
MTLTADYPATSVCSVLGLSRSSFYHRPVEDSNDELRQALQQLAAEYPTYGYRRLTKQLQRAGWTVNHKRVQRLMTEMGLQRPLKRRKTWTTNSQHVFPRYANLVQGLQVTKPDQVWVADITYIRLGQEFVYLAVLMDVFTRAIRGWQLSRSLDRDLTLTALRRALHERRPEIHHSDQGVQYACGEYIALLREEPTIAISMAAVGKPEENGYAERLMRTIKEEEVDLSEYRDFQHAYACIAQFLEEVYTRKRIHSALGYLTPAEFEAQWFADQQLELLVQ